jgi:hypothetical protein
MRAVVERCQHRGPRMHTLVTLGGQHQGVMNVPLCDNPSFNNTPTYACRAMQYVLGWGAYLPFIRTHVIQAQYFKARPRIATPSVCVCASGLGPPSLQCDTCVTHAFCFATGTCKAHTVFRPG